MEQNNLIIRPMEAGDQDAVFEIFRQGIAGGNSSFERRPPSWPDWDAAHLSAGRLFAETEEGPAGWAALSGVSGRCVYAGVAEVSVYVATNLAGRGIGFRLLQELIAESEKAGIWTLQAGIFPENAASVRLHQKCGFRQIGFREKIGKMGDVWRDILLLERRSLKVGRD